MQQAANPQLGQIERLPPVALDRPGEAIAASDIKWESTKELKDRIRLVSGMQDQSFPSRRPVSADRNHIPPGVRTRGAGPCATPSITHRVPFWFYAAGEGRPKLNPTLCRSQPLPAAHPARADRSKSIAGSRLCQSARPTVAHRPADECLPTRCRQTRDEAGRSRDEKRSGLPRPARSKVRERPRPRIRLRGRGPTKALHSEASPPGAPAAWRKSAKRRISAVASGSELPRPTRINNVSSGGIGGCPISACPQAAPWKVPRLPGGNRAAGQSSIFRPKFPSGGLRDRVGNVALGMTGREQHQRQRPDARQTEGGQAIDRHGNRRLGQLQKATLDLPRPRSSVGRSSTTDRNSASPAAVMRAMPDDQ